jgi:hypothetical protein
MSASGSGECRQGCRAYPFGSLGQPSESRFALSFAAAGRRCLFVCFLLGWRWVGGCLFVCGLRAQPCVRALRPCGRYSTTVPACLPGGQHLQGLFYLFVVVDYLFVSVRRHTQTHAHERPHARPPAHPHARPRTHTTERARRPPALLSNVIRRLCCAAERTKYTVQASL